MSNSDARRHRLPRSGCVVMIVSLQATQTRTRTSYPMSYIYQRIAESVRRRIAAGELKPGDHLPAVRETARQWRCTPATVNRAYQELADQGLVVGRRGGGTRVIENPLIDQPPGLDWATLVNRAEQYLLEALGSGHSVDQAHSALVVATSRWNMLQAQPAAERDAARSESRLRFAGSHDLTVELLARRLAEGEPAFRLELDFVGSLGGLIALARAEADIAGVHLWDATENVYNLPFIRRVLPNQRLALVTLVRRKLGFILPPGNPQNISHLADLTRPGVRWFNRQPGSGTRIWLDEQLRLAGIDAGRIAGFGDEGDTHLAVAEAVRNGPATVGLGIQAAALAYGLDFTPLTEELYQLVIPATVWDSPAWQAALDIIRSRPFSAAVNDLGGYNTASAGEIAWI